MIDFSELRPAPRKPTRKEAAKYRRWVRYLSDSKLSKDEVFRRAEQLTRQGRDPEREA